MKVREILTVVHDDELENLMKRLGVFDEFKKGKKRCKFCMQEANFENLNSLFPESGDIKFVCDKPECTMALTKYLNQQK